MLTERTLNQPKFWIAGSTIVSLAIRFWIIKTGVVPFNSDEAIVALMARHILRGEIPVFFYGQSYMGSLDALLVAAGFWLIDEKVWVIRLVQAMLFVLVLWTTYLIGKRGFGHWRVGVIASWILAVPPVNVLLYTTASLGGYVEALLIGNLILILSGRIADHNRDRSSSPIIVEYLGFGVLVGFGVWAFGITLVYSLPGFFLIAYLLFFKRENIGNHRYRSASGKSINFTYVPGFQWIFYSSLGVMIGALPWWGYAMQNGITRLISELQGSAIAGVEGMTWLQQVGQHGMNLVLLGTTVILGLRPPWDVVWLGLPLIPLVLGFWILVFVDLAKQVRVFGIRQPQRLVLVGVLVTVGFGFIFTPFGADPSGRYFLPLAIPLALFAGDFIIQAQKKMGVWTYCLLGLLLVHSLWGIIQSASKSPPGITTQFYSPSRIDHNYDQSLIEFLVSKNETRGYSNYWVSYPLAFQSDETLIYVPLLPYHPDFRYTTRDNRYSPYLVEVKNSTKTAYITTNHPELDSYLRTKFSQLGVRWQEMKIGDYLIFYDLSEVVDPEEINLGEDNP